MLLSLVFVTFCAWATIASPVGSDGRCFRHDYFFDQDAGAWLKFNPMPMMWKDAVLRCYYEGAILASPLNEGIKKALSSIMTDHGMTTALLFTGISNIYAKTEYQSMEGVPISSMCLSWSGEPISSENTCIVMSANGTVQAKSCSDSHPFVCYRENGVTTLNECGTLAPGYKLEQRTGSCYKISKEKLKWDEAFQRCAIDGAHLVIINSQEEVEVLWKLREKQKDTYNSVFIGLRAWGQRRDWITLQGQSMEDAGYSRWANGEPNNANNNEYCSAMYVSGSVTSTDSGVLNDVPCDAELNYICEIEPSSFNQV